MVGEVGMLDRIIRVLLVPAAVIIATAFAPDNHWATAAALLFSAYMVVTALAGQCALYTLLGIHTTRRRIEAGGRELRRAG